MNEQPPPPQLPVFPQRQITSPSVSPMITPNYMDGQEKILQTFLKHNLPEKALENIRGYWVFWNDNITTSNIPEDKVEYFEWRAWDGMMDIFEDCPTNQFTPELKRDLENLYTFAKCQIYNSLKGWKMEIFQTQFQNIRHDMNNGQPLSQPSTPRSGGMMNKFFGGGNK